MTLVKDCISVDFETVWNKPNKDKFMSPFCGFQSKYEKIVNKHNSKFHKNKINFTIVGGILQN